MKTSDLQQMQQQYRLIAENNNNDVTPPMQRTADKFMDLHRDIHNAIDELEQFMASDEFKFAVNNEWMGVDEDESGIIPSDFNDYVEIFFNYLQ